MAEILAGYNHKINLSRHNRHKKYCLVKVMGQKAREEIYNFIYREA